MNLKKHLLLFLFLLSTLSFSQEISEQKNTKVTKSSFPINFTENSFKNLEELNGKIIAFDGEIIQIEDSRNKTPYYKLQVGVEFLWVVLMFDNENQIGDKIRVVGYLSEIPKTLNKKERKYLTNKFHVIAFGLVDFKNSKFLFLNGADIQKQEWIDGKIPSE